VEKRRAHETALQARGRTSEKGGIRKNDLFPESKKKLAFFALPKKIDRARNVQGKGDGGGRPHRKRKRGGLIRDRREEATMRSSRQDCRREEEGGGGRLILVPKSPRGPEGSSTLTSARRKGTVDRDSYHLKRGGKKGDYREEWWTR